MYACNTEETFLTFLKRPLQFPRNFKLKLVTLKLLILKGLLLDFYISFRWVPIRGSPNVSGLRCGSQQLQQTSSGMRQSIVSQNSATGRIETAITMEEITGFNGDSGRIYIHMIILVVNPFTTGYMSVCG